MRRRRRFPRTVKAIVLAATIAASLFALVEWLPKADAHVTQAVTAAVSSEPPKPLWIDVNRPIQLFGLAGSEFEKLPLSYRARRRPEGSERLDLLTYGSLGPETPFLDLSILRTGAAPPAPSDFLADIERVAAEDRLTIIPGPAPVLLPTRFGSFATADLTVAQGRFKVACLGFRLEPDAAEAGSVLMSGLACGSRARSMDRLTLSCVLDRIDLLSAGDDEALQTFFVEAERRRGEECINSRMRAGPRSTWLDGPAPILSLRHLAASATAER